MFTCTNTYNICKLVLDPGLGPPLANIVFIWICEYICIFVYYNICICVYLYMCIHVCV